MKASKGITKRDLDDIRNKLRPGLEVKVEYSSSAKEKKKYKKTMIGIIQPVSEESRFFMVKNSLIKRSYLLVDVINENIVVEIKKAN